MYAGLQQAGRQVRALCGAAGGGGAVQALAGRAPGGWAPACWPLRALALGSICWLGSRPHAGATLGADAGARAAAADWAQLVRTEWEQLKRSFAGATPQGASMLQLPFSLVRALPDAAADRLAERSGYEDKLRLADAEVAGIFDKHVTDVLLVRGRSGSAWLASGAAGQRRGRRCQPTAAHCYSHRTAEAMLMKLPGCRCAGNGRRVVVEGGASVAMQRAGSARDAVNTGATDTTAHAGSDASLGTSPGCAGPPTRAPQCRHCRRACGRAAPGSARRFAAAHYCDVAPCRAAGSGEPSPRAASGRVNSAPAGTWAARRTRKRPPWSASSS